LGAPFDFDVEFTAEVEIEAAVHFHPDLIAAVLFLLLLGSLLVQFIVLLFLSWDLPAGLPLWLLLDFLPLPCDPQVDQTHANHLAFDFLLQLELSLEEHLPGRVQHLLLDLRSPYNSNLPIQTSFTKLDLQSGHITDHNVLKLRIGGPELADLGPPLGITGLTVSIPFLRRST
jgi:hypothetical protein